MVLCAGLGTRLLPITETLPKPLVPILNVENVLFNIDLLQKAGIEEIIVNLHHLSETLEEFLKGHPLIKADLQFSKEPIILGTGGGVKKVEKFFGGQPFVLANCDFVTNVDLSEFILEHQRRKSLATMLLIQDEHRQRKYSKVGVNEEGHLCSLPKLETSKPVKTGIFTGLHIIEPECLKFLKETPCGINDLMYPALMKGQKQRVNGVFDTAGFWLDTGEVDTFLASTSNLLQEIPKNSAFKRTLEGLLGFPLFEHAPQVWGPAELSVPPSLQFVGPVLLGKNISFEGESIIGPSTVIGNGAKLKGPSKLSHCVVFSETSVGSGSDLKECLVYKSHIVRPPNK